jgi:predicted dehydrogenase
MISLGIIGCGYWGPNLLRNFYALPDCQVKYVADPSPSSREYVQKYYPSVKAISDYREVLTSPVDGVVISTPAETHYALAKEFLIADKHVLVEKPLAMLTSEAKELVDLSEKRNRVLMVGHTFEYNAAVRYLKKAIESGQIGKIYYIYAQRLNLGIVRQDINALWSLAPHDISILLYIINKMPLAISATGRDFLQPGIEDVVFMTLYFPEDVIAHVQVSWLDPGKVRRFTIVGSERMIVYDDVSDAKIQIFDKGIKKQNLKDSLGAYDDFGKFQLIKVAGDVVFPKIDFTEPLKMECRHFVDCIVKQSTPFTDGQNGLRVVTVLEGAQRSLKQKGELIKLG